MKLAALAACVLVLFGILYMRHEGAFTRLILWFKKAEERISTLEVNVDKLKDQDYAHGARLDYHHKHIKLLKGDVHALGKDVGWDDNNRKTTVMRVPDPPKNES